MSKATRKYENILAISDYNIDVKSKSLGYNKLNEFSDLLDFLKQVNPRFALIAMLSAYDFSNTAFLYLFVPDWS